MKYLHICRFLGLKSELFALVKVSSLEVKLVLFNLYKIEFIISYYNRKFFFKFYR